MNDYGHVLLVAIIGALFGALIGSMSTAADIERDCAAMGKTLVRELVLTCEVRP